MRTVEEYLIEKGISTGGYVEIVPDLMRLGRFAFNNKPCENWHVELKGSVYPFNTDKEDKWVFTQLEIKYEHELIFLIAMLNTEE